MMAERRDWIPSLKDLDGIRVAVEEPVPLPFAGDVLRRLVEERLREAGLRILGRGDFPTGDPHLRLTLTTAQREGLTACLVQLDFVQIVFMRRNPAVTFNRAQTWKADAQLVFGTTREMSAAVQPELARQVDQFVTDYRAANA